jgi:hypothetical protein
MSEVEISLWFGSVQRQKSTGMMHAKGSLTLCTTVL